MLMGEKDAIYLARLHAHFHQPMNGARTAINENSFFTNCDRLRRPLSVRIGHGETGAEQGEFHELLPEGSDDLVSLVSGNCSFPPE